MDSEGAWSNLHSSLDVISRISYTNRFTLRSSSKSYLR